MIVVLTLGMILAAGCAGRPPAQAWQSSSRGALERFESAFLTGRDRAAQAEFERLRSELAATGRVELVARAELARCALRVASLAFEACAGFEALRQDTGSGEKVYADYLAGQRVDVGLLPAQHRRGMDGTPAAFQGIEDPLARLVALGVAVRSGRGTPELLELGVQTASAQAWRRPLLAWLGAQLQLAQSRGDPARTAALQRRIALVAGER